MAIVTFDTSDLADIIQDIESFKDTCFRFGLEMENNPEREGTSTLEFEVTPQRPDLYSAEGLKRAIKGFRGEEAGLPPIRASESEGRILVDETTKDIRPHIRGFYVSDIEMDDNAIQSLIGFQEKIHTTLGRKREKAAIGLYNADNVTFPVTYTTASPSYAFQPLNANREMTLTQILRDHPTGIEYQHLLENLSAYPLLIDQKGQTLSMPPIINSEGSGRITTDTRNMFVEVTGTHEQTVDSTASILAYILSDRGGHIHRVNVEDEREVSSPELTPKEMTVSTGEINSYLGLSLDASEIASHLERMRLGAESKDKSIRVQVPRYRVDINSLVDIVEETAIAIGYENLEPTVPQVPTHGRISEKSKYQKDVRHLCESIGYTEVMTLTLTDYDSQFTYMGKEETDYVQLAETRNKNLDMIRVSIMPELMKFFSHNSKKQHPMMIYELDDVVVRSDAPNGCHNETHLALASMHSHAQFSQIRSVYQHLSVGLGIEPTLKPSEEGQYIPGRAADIYVGESKIGSFGEIHPRTITAFGLDHPIVGMELNLDEVYR